MTKVFAKPVTAIVVGAGNRGRIYASYAQKHPDELRIVGIVDPDPERQQLMKNLYELPDENIFTTVEELVAKPKLADAIINATMDEYHVETTLPLLPLGYDILLEKPAALSGEGVLQLSEAVKEHGNKIMICHVLRYAPFYYTIKQKLLEGAIGDLLHASMEERVSASHVAVSYVRGKWGNKTKCGSGMLLAKCSHDIDLLVWLTGKEPDTIQSIALGKLFDPANKPEGAGTRCLVDCEIEADCPYSARSHYLEHPNRWPQYVWDFKQNEMTPEERERLIREDSPYGRCVWNADYENISQQSLIVRFGDEMTGSFNMLGGAARGGRHIHLLGSTGEIEGRLEDGQFEIRTINLSEAQGYTTEVIKVDEGNDGHGGGDSRLVADFVRYVAGLDHSFAATTLESSVASHLVIFAAEEAAEEGEVISYGEYSEKLRA